MSCGRPGRVCRLSEDQTRERSRSRGTRDSDELTQAAASDSNSVRRLDPSSSIPELHIVDSVESAAGDANLRGRDAVRLDDARRLSEDRTRERSRSRSAWRADELTQAAASDRNSVQQLDPSSMAELDIVDAVESAAGDVNSRERDAERFEALLDRLAEFEESFASDGIPPPASDAALRDICKVCFSEDTAAAMKQDAQCAICWEEFKDHEQLEQLPHCLHSFHGSCIRQWLGRTSSCPICRQTLFAIGEELGPGVFASVVGLVGSPELNGCHVTCICWDPAGRWLAQMSSSEEKFFIMPGNLRCVKKLTTGAGVRTTGLSSAMAHLNDLRGSCLHWKPDAGRWHVRLDNGEENAFRPENLEFEHAPVSSDNVVSFLERLGQEPQMMQHMSSLLQEILSNLGAPHVQQFLQELIAQPEFQNFCSSLPGGQSIMAFWGQMAANPEQHAAEMQRRLAGESINEMFRAGMNFIQGHTQVHPDAQELPPVLTPPVQIQLNRAKDERLGLSLTPTPKFLLVNGVIEEGDQLGYAKKHNETAEKLEHRLMPMDHIVAVVDLDSSQAELSLVGGSPEKMLEVIDSGCTPLGLLVQRVAGPPVRFSVGQQVKANCGGDRGRVNGRILQQWPRHPQTGQLEAAYAIQLHDGGVVTAPRDDDSIDARGDARFKEGDTVMAHVKGGYKRAFVTKVEDKKVTYGYALEVQPTEDAKDTREVTAPQDLDTFVRAVARFKEGDRVKCNVGQEKYEIGTIVESYHPEWVYTVELDKGGAVIVPLDHDGFCMKCDE